MDIHNRIARLQHKQATNIRKSEHIQWIFITE